MSLQPASAGAAAGWASAGCSALADSLPIAAHGGRRASAAATARSPAVAAAAAAVPLRSAGAHAAPARRAMRRATAQQVPQVPDRQE
jgi:hypothetical protein